MSSPSELGLILAIREAQANPGVLMAFVDRLLLRDDKVREWFVIRKPVQLP